MIDIKAAKKELLAELTVLSAPDGFRPQLREQTFYRPTPFGKCIFHLGFIPHRGVDLDITVDMSVAVDSMLELLNEGRKDFNGRPVKGVAVLGIDIGNWLGTGQKRWTIASPDHVKPVAISIYNDIRNIGEPFFEHHSNMDNILQLLLSSSPLARVMVIGHLWRCRAAIALAFLRGKAAEIDAVIQACERFLSEKGPEELPEFAKFTHQLRGKQQKGTLPKLITV